MATYDDIAAALAPHGFMARGGFHPTGGDNISGETVLIIGNAGPAMWRRFSRTDGPDAPDALDAWTRRILDPVAAAFGARALYPFDGPPYAPFLKWAAKAEPVFASPVGMTIHPEYGLWHAYRGAFIFAEKLELPSPVEHASPCLDCADQPCLSTCPVDAFKTDRYDVESCATHLRNPAGADCMAQGCRARRACPVGQDFRYAPDQAAFHMGAFLKNR
ncbi:MAG: 4Fe-4S dicluster domain-containing protein [Rhodospirillaceae bacterium]|jgi:hypothetical protein|nr:4Fe-4S dicluster domain-containing protein [Rhodospirillaceae bacterium]MBT5666183.1 4Fe-4S dicluster domain-containing protein [Rhodospirillaceae bacterium]